MKILILLVALALGGASSSAQPALEASSVFKDAEWQARFLGSYGFLSGAEPKVGESELVELRLVLDLLKADPKAAAAMLQQQITPQSSASLYFILANLQFQTSKMKSAATNYRRAIEKFPDFRRAHKNLGLLLVQNGLYEKGVSHLSRAVELGERDGRVYGLMGYCYLNLENHLAAEQAYRNALLSEPDVKDWKLGLVRSLLTMERQTEALALLDVLIAEDPDNASLWLLAANAHLGLEQPLEAAVHLEAVRLMGESQTSSLVLLGDIYMNAGMPEFAKNAYLEVIDRDGKASEYKTAYRAAELLVRTRAWDEAEAVLGSIGNRYKKLETEEELAVLTLRAKVARAKGKEQEAVRLLESIVERDGTRGEALLELAAHHRGQGNTEKAILMIERAERLGEYQYPALLAHAQLRVGEKDYAQAASLLRRALKIKSEPRVERFLARVTDSVRK